jgi:hypothetical protein
VITAARRIILFLFAMIGSAAQSLPVDSDISFAAAVREGKHHADTYKDNHSDHGPPYADTRYDTQFPKCGDNASD